MKKQIAIAHKKGEIPPENQDLERKKFILEFDNASFNHLKHISFVVFAVNSGLIASLFKEFNKNKSIILILAIGILYHQFFLCLQWLVYIIQIVS